MSTGATEKSQVRAVGFTLYLSSSRRGGVKYPSLHLRGEGRVDRQDDELRNLWAEGLHPLIEDLT